MYSDISRVAVLKDMVKDNKKVHFVQCHEGNLWYDTDCGFRFAVPQEDTKGGTFLAEDKAIFFMRWIKPYIKQHETLRLEGYGNLKREEGKI